MGTENAVDEAEFYLSPAKWDEFCSALEGPPRNCPDCEVC